MKKTLKATWKIVSTVLKVAALLLVILILTPFGYFAWRAGQPMSMPEYDGRTYYELLAERHQAYADWAAKYQVGHPNITVRTGACFFSEISVEILAIPNSAFYTLAAIYPDLRKNIDPRDIHNGYLPENVTWLNFLLNWWNGYEKFIWGTLEHAPHGPVPYCRLPVP